ncbi:PE family protein [Mycobacterium palustre]|nr:PE family protein [Mycobacterium palustre]
MAAPAILTAAAVDVAGVGSTLNAAHVAAAPPTIGLIPAAADEVSAGIAQLFSRCAQDYHALAARAAAFNEQFVQHLKASADSYVAAEAAAAASLQHLNASPASSVGGIAAAVPTQLTEAINGIWNMLTSFAATLQTFLFELALIPVIGAYLLAGLAYLIIGFAILAVQFSQFFVLVL